MGEDNAMQALHPGKGRKCTDVLCTLLFLLFWGGMWYISITGFTNGDPDRLLYGLDYKFDQCRKDNTLDGRRITSLTQEVAYSNGTAGTKKITLGGKNLTASSFYYAFAKGTPRWTTAYSGVCLNACPNVGGIGIAPSDWVCTGKYYAKSNRPDLSAAGVPQITAFNKAAVQTFLSDVAGLDSTKFKEQLEYLNSFFLLKADGTCADTAANDAAECTICYPAYPTVQYGSSAYCLPDVSWIQTNAGVVKEVLGEQFDLTYMSKATDTIFGNGGATTIRIVADAYAALPVILGCIAGSVVLGFVWAYLLRLFVRPVVLLTIVGVLAALALGAWVLWKKADEMRLSGLYGLDASFTRYADTTMGFFAANLATLALYVLFVTCFWSRIWLACGVITEASKALAAMPSLLLVPLIPAVATFGLFVYFVLGAFWIVSSGQLKVDGSGVAQINYDDNLKGALAYHFFGCVWTSVLLNHLGWAVVAAAVTQWYFAKDKKGDLGSAPVVHASLRVLRYHFGSVVFGSLLVAIVRYIRYMVNFVKRYASVDNRCFGGFVRCIWCCIDCCLRCFERVLEFISRSAYILVAVEAESFCTSARHAFGFVASNGMGFALVQVLGDTFLFLGKTFVAVVSAGVCGLVLTNNAQFNASTSSIILPCLVVLVGAYLVGSLFFGIYEMAIDTVFLCFCIDEDKQLGYADGALKDFVKANERAVTDPKVVSSTAPAPTA